MNIETEIPYIDETLASWETQMGNEYLGYRNHVYRMVNIAFHLHPCTKEEKRKIVIAGIFHDLSIWEKQTMDYLDPSIAMALAYLEKNNLEDWTKEISLMISEHHKLSEDRTLEFPLVEIFSTC